MTSEQVADKDFPTVRSLNSGGTNSLAEQHGHKLFKSLVNICFAKKFQIILYKRN